MWALCLTGFTLGVNVAMATTYSIILTRPPYNWPVGTVSYVNCGQIPVALICFPILGWASDKLIETKARRNHGMHEPETRLIMLFVPLAIGVVAVVFYGQAAAFPEHYHASVFILSMAGYFFAFVGSSIVSMTYLLDSYPNRAGPVLILICALRGVISFLVSFNVAHFVNSAGYDGTFNAFGGVTVGLGLLGIVMIFFGKTIRKATTAWTKDGAI